MKSWLTYFVLVPIVGTAADFTVKEHLGHTWENEQLTFPLDTQLARKAADSSTLIGPEGKETPFQLVNRGKTITFQTDLAPLGTKEFNFARSSEDSNRSLLSRQGDFITIGDIPFAISLRKELKDGEGPIAGFHLSGKTSPSAGGSKLRKNSKLVGYTTEVVEDGRVTSIVDTETRFEDGGKWTMTFKSLAGQNTILVEESFDMPAGGTFELDLSGNVFQPTNIFYRGGAGGKLGKIYSEPVAEGRAFVVEPWLHWWGEERKGNWFTLHDNKDMLMLGALRPSAWKEPDWKGKAAHVPVNIKVANQGGMVTAHFPLGGGQRHWILAKPDIGESLAGLGEKNRNLSPLPQHYLIKHGDFPLDEVKDMVLEWAGDHLNYPRLMMGKEEVEQWKKRHEIPAAELQRWERKMPITNYNIAGPIRAYFGSGSQVLSAKMIQTVTKMMDHETINAFLTQKHRASLGFAPHQQANTLMGALSFLDACLAIPDLDPALRKKLLAQAAFIGYAVTSDNYWSPERGFSANPNMTTTVAQFQVTVACLIPSHPMAKTWAEKGLRTLRHQLENWSDEDGGWLEAPHYAMVAYDHILGAFLMAARAGFGDYVYEDRMKKVAQWFARISTPRDHHTSNFRHYPPIGNTYHGEGTGMFGIIAGIWKDRDPQFAAEMQWWCEEHGSPGIGIGGAFPGLVGYKKLLMEHGVQPRMPKEAGSHWFKDTGVVLRNQLGTERETYLHLIAGKNHEHYDYDSGSIVVWGKGRVGLDDWGYIGRHAAQYHSMLTSTQAGGVMKIQDFSTQAHFDYVSGNKGTWQRQIAFVKDKDPDAPNYFLIRDTHTADTPATWKLWLTSRKDPKPEPSLDKTDNKKVGSDLLEELQGNEKPKAEIPKPPVQIHDAGATVDGESDVDFDIFIHNAGQLNLKTETAAQQMAMAQRDGKQGRNILTQTALIGTLPKAGVITSLIYPRLKSEKPPQVRWHADGQIAEVKLGMRTDYVHLSSDASPTPKNAGRGIHFTGQAGAILGKPSRAIITLGSPGKITRGEDKLQSKSAATKAVHAE